jgi:O-antigen/teichoic acid export membrane protein
MDSILAKLMGDVAFPTFSEIVRERQQDLKRSYYRFHAVIASVAYLFSGMLITFGQTLIDLLFDHRYAASGQMIAVLAPILLAFPFRLATQSFLALGRPELQSHTLSIRLISLFVLTPTGFAIWGISGALIGIVLSHFSYVPLIIRYNLKHQLFDGRREMFLIPVFLIGLVLGKLGAAAIGYLH